MTRIYSDKVLCQSCGCKIEQHENSKCLFGPTRLNLDTLAAASPETVANYTMVYCPHGYRERYTVSFHENWWRIYFPQSAAVKVKCTKAKCGTIYWAVKD
jgi:hypothetical protein